MSILSFNPHFKSGTSIETELELPVEIRRPNLTVAARSLTSQRVDLDPGDYYVTATLPGGQEMYGHIKLADNQNATVDLMVDPEVESPRESEERQRYIWGVSGFETFLEAQGGANTAKLRVFQGNLLRRQLEVAATPPGELLKRSDADQPPGVTVFTPQSGEIQLVQLLQPGRVPINMALPMQGSGDCYIAVTLQAGGSYVLSIHLSRSEVETLVRYMEQGMVAQAAEITKSAALQAEGLVLTKRQDLWGAVVGAYALLQLGALERLHNWTANLLNWFSKVPDGIPIRAEHLARIGDHKGALELLLRLPERGMPFFSDGLSYTLDRLRLYTGAGKRHFASDQQQSAQTLLEQLLQFEPYVDFSKAILTFTGLDPSNPDDQAVETLTYDTIEGVIAEG